MPYPGVPDELTEKMERCVEDVMAQHKGEKDFDKGNAIAICKSRIVKSRSALVKIDVNAPIRSIDGKEGKYRAYAVLFNDEETKDSYGTWFDQETEYALDWYRSRPWLYEHTFHPDLPPVQAKVGEWKEAGIDDLGVWVEGELDRHHKYRKAIEELIARRALYPSSGTLPYAAQVEENGHVRFWAIVEVSSTVSPANWQAVLEDKAISPVVRSFYEEIGGIDMEKVDEKKVNMFMRAWEAFKEVFDAKEEQEEIEEVRSGGDLETESTQEHEEKEQDVDEGLRAELEKMREELERVGNAIRTIDEYLKNEQPRFEATRRMVRELAESRADQLKSFIEGNSPDWTKELFVASRSGEEIDPSTAEKIKNESSAGEDAGDVGGVWESI